MKKSDPKLSQKGYEEWMASLEQKDWSTKAQILQFVKEKTVQAYKEDSFDLLPDALEISKHVGVCLETIRHICVALYRECEVGRMKRGKMGFIYYAPVKGMENDQ